MLVDARGLDPAERDALIASHIRRMPAEPREIAAALTKLGGKPVYLHVDVDIIDSTQLPGLRVPGGPGPGLTKIEHREPVTPRGELTGQRNRAARPVAQISQPSAFRYPSSRLSCPRISAATDSGPRIWRHGS